MPNPRFLQTAERWKNPILPEERSRQKSKQQTQTSAKTGFPDDIPNSFLFSYDGQNGQFFQALIAKNNEVFAGTRAEIPTGSSGEVKYMHIMKRAGLITSIYNDPQLRSMNLYPITPAQSEHLLKEGNLPKPGDNWEDLALVLYDRSSEGENSREAQALYESLKKHKQDLGLSNSDLENRLIVVNFGIEKDDGSNYGVKPIVLPGLTQVYTHEALSKVGEDPEFNGYGLNGGLPLLNQLGSGSRTLYMPDETKDMGLRVLFRDGGLVLYAWFRDLAVDYEFGRVNFAPQARAP
jgi:hypothetical protein